MKKPSFLALRASFLPALIVLAVATPSVSCSLPYRWMGGYPPGSFESNGERIYFTATSSSGQPIGSSGGVQMMRQGAACADCHGPQGRGGRVTMMMRSFKAPDITWDNLTEEEHNEEKTGEEEHGEHPPYTEETLRRANTRGIDPAGEPLDELMPQWRMSETDLDDLVEFIMTLE